MTKKNLDGSFARLVSDGLDLRTADELPQELCVPCLDGPVESRRALGVPVVQLGGIGRQGSPTSRGDQFTWMQSVSSEGKANSTRARNYRVSTLLLMCHNTERPTLFFWPCLLQAQTGLKKFLLRPVLESFGLFHPHLAGPVFLDNKKLHTPPPPPPNLLFATSLFTTGSNRSCQHIPRQFKN